MNVNGVSAADGAFPMTGASAPPTPALNGTMAGIAQTLQLPADSVRGQLRAGRSLADIASSQGVSRDDLATAIVRQVDRLRTARGQDPLDPTVADRMVGRAIDRRLR